MSIGMAIAVATGFIDSCPIIESSIAQSIPKTAAPVDSNPGPSPIVCVNFSMAPQLFEMATNKLPKISNGTFPANIKNNAPLLGSTLLRQDSMKK